MEYVQDILNSYPLSELDQLDMFGFNWLHVTLLRNELDIFKLLVDTGFDHSIKNSAGETAFDMAYRFGQWKFVRFFLGEG